MLGLMLAAAVAAVPAPPAIVAGSRGRWSDLRVMKVALTAPERPRRRGEARFCFDDTITQPNVVRRVCRSRSDWNAFELDPVLPAAAAKQIASN